MIINVNEFIMCTSDSEMIQAALNKACVTGQSVVIPKHNARTGKSVWMIDQTILLHDESVLILQNAHLRMADDAFCNMFSNKNARTDFGLTKEGKQRNITIKGIGKALLDGGVHNGKYECNGISRKVIEGNRPDASLNCMIFMQNVEHLLLDNLTIKDQRYWAVCLYTTTYSRISNIHLISSSNVPNQDGIDLLKGCHDVIIENVTGCTGDNAVALLATDDEIYKSVGENQRDGDIYNITIRDIMVYCVNGPALIRLLNHDGFRIYNVKIDNVIETSPWSREDSSVAPNPDLYIFNDDEGNVFHTRKFIPGEEGYRCEAAIIIGESYWYSKEKAKHGDTFGISVSNVMTHARYGIFLNNTLLDSSFDNIRIFGNGFMAAYFGEGHMENVRFNNLFFDKDARPLESDEHIYVQWNQTKSDGYSCMYFNTTELTNVSVSNMYCSGGMDSVFGGCGTGNVVCHNIVHNEIPVFSTAEGVQFQ